MAKKLSTLPVGAKVKDNQSLYFGKPIIWQIADKNHTGYPANSVTLITEKIICLKSFDAKEPDNSDYYMKECGNNNYKLSNLNKWLNSTGSWYVAQHGQDAPPTSWNVANRRNPYDEEVGFLTGFSQQMKNALMETTLKSMVGGNFENVKAKVFLASITEVGFENENGIAEGSKLALFTDNNSKTCYPTAEAVNHSTTSSFNFSKSESWSWWLRTPYTSHRYTVWSIYSIGTPRYGQAYSGEYGVRPLCNLSSETLVSDSPDSDGAYRIEWNEPPTPPSSITVPEVIKSNKAAKISWGTALDPEGGSIGYELERKIDSNGWTRIYKGINKEFTDNIVKGWGTVAYRVKAYDNHGTESGYTTGPTRTVKNNEDPTINTSAGSDLGAKTGPFNLSYSVNDGDAVQMLTVKEYIDGIQKKSYTAERGHTYELQITKENWQELLNGSHNLKIVAEDSEGGRTEKTFTFSKNETEIELELKTPLPADERVTKALINLYAEIPDEAIMTVEACNNAFDEEPTWEDVTTRVKKGSKLFFKNKEKTSEKWGFNVRVKVDRNGATGECYITGIGGNFE